MTQTNNLSMVRGDTFIFGIELEGLDSLDAAFFTMKSNYDGAILVQKKLGGGIELDKPNTYRVRVAPEDTKQLATGRYLYDLQVNVGDDVFTVLRGIITVEPEVTL